MDLVLGIVMLPEPHVCKKSLNSGKVYNYYYYYYFYYYHYYYYDYHYYYHYHYHCYY